MHHNPWREDATDRTVDLDLVEPSPEEAVRRLKKIGATLVRCGHLHDDAQIKLGKSLQGIRTAGLGRYRQVDLWDNDTARTHVRELEFDLG